MFRVVRPIATAVFVSAMALQAVAQGTGTPSGPPAAGRNTSESSTMNTDKPGSKPPPPTASTNAYREAGTQLQLDMGIRYTGDADKDFAALLAAYGKGMVATARIELQHGKDPDMRRLAEQIIQANEKDAGQIKAWQSKHQ